ncbi:hypothetical protein LC087_05425 [Bacillus carboniphilus]|uniref:Uncharacterized protein n=1 Tax=Bacillus carboniphilus TaxID=86663 RepID=A0ABY9K180_9BACI|nr:hypothetical protein [Bacillus carboniphilus]WLR43595.1 hypothetical protein LC087_05425 [Bacillus carboniphilus]
MSNLIDEVMTVTFLRVYFLKVKSFNDLSVILCLVGVMGIEFRKKQS